MALGVTGLYLVKESTTTTGDTTPTFNITLLGAESGFQSFEARLGIGNQTYVFLRHNTAWMYGLMTLTAYNTLRIDSVIASSDNNNPLVLGAGTKYLYIAVTDDMVKYLLNQIAVATMGKVLAYKDGSHAG